MCASVNLNGKFDVEVISFVLVSKSHQNCEKKKIKKNQVLLDSCGQGSFVTNIQDLLKRLSHSGWSETKSVRSLD